MRSYVKILSALFFLTAVSAVNAQQQGGPGGGPGGPGGPGDGGPGGGGPGGPGGPDGGPPDPQQMQAMMDQRIKQALNTTDDIWNTLQPLIDKVEMLEHQTDTGPLMHGRPHRDEDQDGDNQDDDRPHSPVESAISKLKKVLSDKSSSDETIKTATAVVEEAEKKAKDDLAAARKELVAAVNVRQQAVLVALGVLD